MERSEPTTDDVVARLRKWAKVWAKVKDIDNDTLLFLADRLESQQREIERLEDECGCLMMSVDLAKAAWDAEKARADAT